MVSAIKTATRSRNTTGKQGSDQNGTYLSLNMFGGGTLVPPVTGLKPRLLEKGVMSNLSKRHSGQITVFFNISNDPCFFPKGRTQLVTISSARSACILFMRRSGISLRHFLIVAPLLSLNGKLSVPLFFRLSSFRSLLSFMIMLFGINSLICRRLCSTEECDRYRQPVQRPDHRGSWWLML